MAFSFHKKWNKIANRNENTVGSEHENHTPNIAQKNYQKQIQ